MKNNVICRCVLVLSLHIIVGCFSLYAQKSNTAEMTLSVSIPAVAMIDFEGGEQLITYQSKTQIEQIITPFTNDQTWLNYSSIVEDGRSNYITVHISAGNLPAEASISLSIGDDSGSGAGKTGDPGSEIQLSRYPQNIITNIGSCFTGKGVNKGHQLKYIWSNIEDFNNSKYSKSDFKVTVTYTITTTE